MKISINQYHHLFIIELKMLKTIYIVPIIIKNFVIIMPNARFNKNNDTDTKRKILIIYH